jgi:hypothetical protein
MIHILALRPLVERMPNVENKIMWARVAVCLDILEIRMRVVDRSALLIQIAHQVQLVYNTNVKILVPETVV